MFLIFWIQEIHPHILVGEGGFEPPTPCSQGRCSINQAELFPDKIILSKNKMAGERFELSRPKAVAYGATRIPSFRHPAIFQRTKNIIIFFYNLSRG